MHIFPCILGDGFPQEDLSDNATYIVDTLIIDRVMASNISGLTFSTVTSNFENDRAAFINMYEVLECKVVSISYV